MMEKLRRLGGRWPWLGRLLDVHERVGEINGGFAASAITVTIFLSIFPLLLVAISVVGFLNAGNEDLAGDVVDKLGLTGQGAQAMTDALQKASDSRQAASIIGLLVLVGAVYVPQMISKSSALYGSIGIVFGLLAWLALFARLLVYSSTLNAVLFEAREGTLQVPIHVPNLPGVQPVGATRGGVIIDPGDPAPAVPT